MWGTSPNLPISRTSFHYVTLHGELRQMWQVQARLWRSLNGYKLVQSKMYLYQMRYKVQNIRLYTCYTSYEYGTFKHFTQKKCCFSSISLSLLSAFSDSFSPTLKKSSSTGLIINRFWHQTTCMWMNPGSATTQHIIELLCSSMSSSRKWGQW